jgi:hypothetical protein
VVIENVVHAKSVQKTEFLVPRKPFESQQGKKETLPTFEAI